MEAEFWHERWSTGRIAFHESGGNALFQRHFPALGLAKGARVFVPLCGKSEDIAALLAMGFDVVGAELNGAAVDALFEALGAVPETQPQGALERRSLPRLDIFVGDIFALSADALGPIDAIYDRAALIALPEPMRRDYVRHLGDLAPGAAQLLITLDYDQGKLNGPPFSVPPAMVDALYPGRARLLERRRIAEGLRGLAEVDELVWHLPETSPQRSPS